MNWSLCLQMSLCSVEPGRTTRKKKQTDFQDITAVTAAIYARESIWNDARAWLSYVLSSMKDGKLQF